ncbi:MAG: CopG family transcriptional regulator [Candidatus Delongbacteria bacterium]
MSLLTLRLPEPLEVRLASVAQRLGLSKSELARQALVVHLLRLERSHEMSGLVAELQRCYGDPLRLAELEELADSPFDGLDARIDAERRAGLNPDDPWWS